MKSTWTLKENSTGTLRVEVEADAWKKAQEKAFDKLAKNIEVKGFRKGEAPRNLVEKQMNQQGLLMEAMEQVANEAFVAGLLETKIDPVAQPQLDIESMTEDALVLLFEVTVKPEVTLGEYKGIVIESEPITVSDDEVAAELEALRNEQAQLIVKEEGTVENGDIVVIDFKGFKDGEAFEGGTAENQDLEIGSGSFIDGFEEQLVGMTTGETKTIQVTFPEEYHAEDLKGQPVEFEVTVHEIKFKEVPELNDEFVEMLDDEAITTVDALKDSIHANLLQNRTVNEENRVLDELVQTVAANASMEIPTPMVEEELDQMMKEFEQRLVQQGMNLELYSQVLNQQVDELRDHMREDAQKRVRTRLTLEKIAEVEEIKATEEETDAEFAMLAEMYGMEVDHIKEHISLEAVQYDLVLRKAIELLKENKA